MDEIHYYYCGYRFSDTIQGFIGVGDSKESAIKNAITQIIEEIEASHHLGGNEPNFDESKLVCVGRSILTDEEADILMFCWSCRSFFGG